MHDKQTLQESCLQSFLKLNHNALVLAGNCKDFIHIRMVFMQLSMLLASSNLALICVLDVCNSNDKLVR